MEVKCWPYMQKEFQEFQTYVNSVILDLCDYVVRGHV